MDIEIVIIKSVALGDRLSALHPPAAAPIAIHKPSTVHNIPTAVSAVPAGLTASITSQKKTRKIPVKKP